jgi:hypothetical protein
MHIQQEKGNKFHEKCMKGEKRDLTDSRRSRRGWQKLHLDCQQQLPFVPLTQGAPHTVNYTRLNTGILSLFQVCNDSLLRCGLSIHNSILYVYVCK